MFSLNVHGGRFADCVPLKPQNDNVITFLENCYESTNNDTTPLIDESIIKRGNWNIIAINLCIGVWYCQTLMLY